MCDRYGWKILLSKVTINQTFSTLSLSSHYKDKEFKTTTGYW